MLELSVMFLLSPFYTNMVFHVLSETGPLCRPPQEMTLEATAHNNKIHLTIMAEELYIDRSTIV